MEQTNLKIDDSPFTKGILRGVFASVAKSKKLHPATVRNFFLRPTSKRHTEMYVAVQEEVDKRLKNKDAGKQKVLEYIESLKST